jgi:hypothetical protein
MSFDNFFKILGGNVFVTSILGLNIYSSFPHWNLWAHGILPAIVSILGLCVLGYVFWKSKMELRLFLIYSFLIFAASLVNPLVSLVEPQWNCMANFASGNRYYLFPILAFLLSITFIYFNEENRCLKYAAGVLLICSLFVGIPADFIFRPYKDYDFQKQALVFEKLAPGKVYEFKINPGWKFKLTKR